MLIQLLIDGYLLTFQVGRLLLLSGFPSSILHDEQVFPQLLLRWQLIALESLQNRFSGYQLNLVNKGTLLDLLLSLEKSLN